MRFFSFAVIVLTALTSSSLAAPVGAPLLPTPALHAHPLCSQVAQPELAKKEEIQDMKRGPSFTW